MRRKGAGSAPKLKLGSRTIFLAPALARELTTLPRGDSRLGKGIITAIYSTAPRRLRVSARRHGSTPLTPVTSTPVEAILSA